MNYQDPAPATKRSSLSGRRAIAILAALSVTVTGISVAHADTTTSTPTIAPMQARSAESLINSVGVNTHTAYTSTAYGNTAMVTQRLNELGVTHVRERLVYNNATQLAALKQLQSAGIRFNFVAGDPTLKGGTPEQLVSEIGTEFAGSTDSIEGANEWNLSGRPNWVAEDRAYQARIYAAAKSNPATKDIPVLAPSMGLRKGYEQLGDVSAFADEGNVHAYPGGDLPDAHLGEVLPKASANVAGKPIVVTETGYHNAMATTGGHPAITEDAAAAYVPRSVFDHFQAGVVRNYFYELLDERPNPANNDQEQNFGLVRNDYTPKPAFTALSNTMALLNDPNGANFVPTALPVSITGDTSGVRSQLLQKADGTYYLALWRGDAKNWDPKTQQPITVASKTVSVNFANIRDVSVFRPSVSSTQQGQARGTTLNVAINTGVVVLQISGQAVTPTVVTPEMFGAKGDGVTDDTASIQKALDFLTPGTSLKLAAGKSYRYTQVLQIDKPGSKIIGTGTLLATNADATAVWIDASNVTVEDVTIKLGVTMTRSDGNEHDGLLINHQDGSVIQRVTIDGSGAAGIMVQGGSNYLIEDVTVNNSLAYGIASTSNSFNGKIVRPNVVNPGDDGVTVTSYVSDGGPSHDITIDSPKMTNQAHGRGFSVVGGQNITFTNIYENGSSGAGVYIASEDVTTQTLGSNNVKVLGGTLENSNLRTDKDHGAVLVSIQGPGSTNSNIDVENLVIKDTRATASSQLSIRSPKNQAFNQQVQFKNIQVTGGPSQVFAALNTPTNQFNTVGITHDGNAMANNIGFTS